MLEVDLLRGESGLRRQKAGPALPRTAGQGLSPDPWTIGSGLTILVSLGLALYLVLSVRSRTSALEEALGAALADSVHGAVLIEKVHTMEARRDSIAARVAIIRDVDAQRYLWPRIMDEVAGALPADAWLTNLAQAASQDESIRFQVEGMTRDNATLTGFWNGMEASPFVRRVRLVSTENVVAGSGVPGSVDLYHFVLMAEPEDPPSALLDLVSFLPGARR